jgi:tyrosinase
MGIREYGGDFGFCSTLDSSLHGDVHTGVGDTTNMGRIPFAAGDPIFWLHHANIDRIWAGWNAAGGTNPPLGGSFAFAGPGGERIDVQTSDMLSAADLDYRYDTLPTPPAGIAPVAGGPPAPAQTLATSAGPVLLGNSGAEVSLAPTSPTPFATTAAGGGGTRLYVILDGLRARAQPGVLYEVFLNLPQGASAALMKSRYIGTVNFFGAPTDEHAEHQPRRTIALDITNRTAAVQASGGEPGGLPRVTILPVEPPASGSEPLIEAVRVIRR